MTRAIKVVVIMLALTVSTALSAMIGERCGGDSDCISTAMECIKRFDECEEKACWCKPKYGGRFDSDCDIVLEFGQYCGNNINNCGEGMTCGDSRYCECDDGWTLQNDVCVDDRKSLGGTCASSKECKDNMTCSGEKCECYFGYFADGNVCRRGRWGEDCNFNTRQCEYYDCSLKSGSDYWCNCATSEKRVKYQRDDQYDEDCAHKDATTDIGVGEVCNYVSNEYGKYCRTDLTCSRCLNEDEPFCITPVGKAVTERAHIVLILSAFSALKLF